MNPIDPAVTIADLGRRSRAAARVIARSTTGQRNRALAAIADALEAGGRRSGLRETFGLSSPGPIQRF